MNISSDFKVHKLIFALLLIFSYYPAVSQTNYYVSASGSDSNNGLSDSTPFLTANKAISLVSPGDTILVMNGTYRNSGYGTVDVATNSNMNNPHVITIDKSGTPGAYITLKNYPGHSPKIEFDGKGGIVISNDMNYIIVEGFEVEGPAASITYNQAIADRNYKIQVAEDGDANTNYNHSYFSGKGIWGNFGAHKHIIIRNNVVYNTGGSGIRFNDSDHITVEYNTVYNTTWWSSSAESAIVFAETIAESGDNGTDVKMIMRGNVVYNNWNRIPFYKTQEPDNSGNTNPDYGTASYSDILDGQGLYVTRSDVNYNGTFLFENNVCVNNGKNGINFDNSLAAGAIYQNNTLYYNGVHEIIQDLSEAEGNTAHRGQKVGGIKANKVKDAKAVNNIVVTRDNIFSALEFNNMSGVYSANNNIFLNGTLKNPSGVTNEFDSTNLINSNPSFVSAPAIVNDSIDISQTNFNLMSDSPAINAGDNNYASSIDINQNSRPVGISQTSFEDGIGNWVSFGSANLELSSSEYASGEKSLFISNRTFNYSSPRLYLDNLLKINESYTFSVKVKLASGASGTADITIRNNFNSEVTFTNLLSSPISVNDQNWTELTGNFTYTGSDEIFVYIKGPTQSEGHGDFYIDDFSIVPQGSNPVDFNNVNLTVDIGAYELIATTWSGNIDSDWNTSGNWSNGVVTSSLDAIIGEVDNAPVINSNYGIEVHNLTINESEGVTINSGGTLIVNGTSSGNVTYKRTLGTENWYLVGSPVSGETFNDAYVSANNLAISGTNNAIATYLTASNGWSYLQTGVGGTFSAGVGYSVRRADNKGSGDISFTGTINTNNSGVDVVLNTTGSRFNLLANPYASHVNSATFLASESAISDTQTIWVWNQELGVDGSYEVQGIEQEFYLAPAQGFFVKANASGGTFNFAESNQSSTGGTFQKLNTPQIKLWISEGDVKNYCRIKYSANATQGFDVGLDGEMFGGSEPSFAVYSHLLADNEGKKYQLQALPNSEYEKMVVPVGIIADAGKKITFTAEVMNLPTGLKVFLEDRQTSTFTRLDEANTEYTITLDQDLNDVGRFYVHTSASALSTPEFHLEHISVYTTNSNNLRIVGIAQGNASVKLYNMLGKEIMNTTFIGNHKNDVELPNLKTGIYIARVSSSKISISKKIIIY